MQDQAADRSYLVTLWTYGGRELFADTGTALLFCRVLAHLRRRLGFRVHAYVVLPDRARMILGSDDRDPRWIQPVVQRVKQRFAREYNVRHRRLGLVWQDAEQRLPLAGPDDVGRRADLLHRLPILSGLAGRPEQWRFSSARAWAGQGSTPVPVDPPGADGVRQPAGGRADRRPILSG
jgi:putative transposase